ncbi:AAA family ATPase [Micromonospora sp. C95]|uniref:AAA family ATPase n=1 Tax=Micromonospora sp. C95 TaxID=2824882 RepID=UPI001B35C954|nr:AAA-like domain-containing protein [Micromonospora sp. C95]MBQ1027982.1 AAA-like domain-containing protein [Micromonospora sp. C95]
MSVVGTGTIDNPFATVGHIVHGDAHVGRLNLITVLRQRVLLPESGAGATAIVGPPRIGKSSLAYHVFMRSDAKALQPRLLPVWINLRIQPNAERLFRKFVAELWSQLQDHPDADIDEPLGRRHDRVRVAQDGIELQDAVQDFLKILRRRGWRVLLILDEFDAAREVFKPFPGTFQALRELAYNPEWSIGLVTTSRRELRDIVNRADPVESTFPGIFRQVQVTCFDEAELSALTRRASCLMAGADDTSLVERLVELTGGHPYLASMALERLCGQGASAPVSDAEWVAAVTACRVDFHRYYRDLEDLLRADGRLQALLEVLLGPQITVTSDDAERLLHQGLIRAAGETFQPFSRQFGEYLMLVGRHSDHWQSWIEVESGLRELLETTLSRALGADWPAELCRVRPKLADMLSRCAQMRDREQHTFGQRASTRLLDFTYPRDLYDIVAARWDLFGSVFGHDKRYWNDRFELLAKVRNPMAHNRMLMVTPTERNLFQSYCMEILDMLTALENRTAEPVDPASGSVGTG